MPTKHTLTHPHSLLYNLIPPDESSLKSPDSLQYEPARHLWCEKVRGRTAQGGGAEEDQRQL